MSNNNLIVVPSFIIGGSERVQYIAAKELICKGQKCNIYFLSNKGNLQSSFWSDPTLRSSIYFSNSKRESFGIIYLIAHIFRMNFNNVFCSNTHINGIVCFFRFIQLFKCKRLVIRESTDIFNRFTFWKSVKYRIYHLMYFTADRIILQHQDMYKEFEKRYPFYRGKLKVVLNPLIYMKKFNNSKNDGIINVLMVGRLDSNKNHILALHAFRDLLLIHDNYLLTIVGSGAEFNELENFINTNNLTGKIVIHNDFIPVENIYQISNFNIFLHTSIHEGFPNVIIEAMQNGVDLVISTFSNSYLSNLPNIKIVGFNSESIKLALLEFRSLRPSFKEKYKKYVNEYHSVENFYFELFE